MKHNVQAEPLPVRKTRSIGQPQLISTKSTFPTHSFAMTSAVGTMVTGLFPAICTPKVDSEGWRRTSDHSSLDPDRNEVASPTGGSYLSIVKQASVIILTFTASNVGSIIHTESTERLHVK